MRTKLSFQLRINKMYTPHFKFLIFSLVFINVKSFQPYEPGPYEVKYITYYSLFNGGLDHNLSIYAPWKTAGKFPIIYFFTGLGGKDIIR